LRGPHQATPRPVGESVRIPKNKLDELESMRRYARGEVLSIATLRYLAMERQTPTLVTWIA
jgi:hypothetical protein